MPPIGSEIYLEIFDTKSATIEVPLFTRRAVGGNFSSILAGFVRCLKNTNYQNFHHQLKFSTIICLSAYNKLFDLLL